MSPDRWERLKHIFSEALAKPGAAREAFLTEACGDDTELLRDARRLLADHERGAEFPSSLAIRVTGDADAEPLFQDGQLLAGRFRIVRFLARGGMGEVYEAEDLMLEQRVALKTIQPGLVNESTIGLLKHELQSARRVSHPNVCRTYDITEHPEPRVTLFTMELLEGPTLSGYVREHGPFSRAEALPLAEQLASGLQAAHDAGVIHGDFKAGNVILAGAPGAWRPVITDFGLALTPNSRKQIVGLRAGTPGYMAPEQLAGKPATTATDVYAFGVVLALMIGARNASGAGAPSPATPEFPPVDDWTKAGRWRAVLERCLAADPAQRYQHPAEIARALRGSSIRRWAVPLAVAAALLIAGGVMLWREMRPEQAGFVTRKIADEGEFEYFQDVSSDGRWIAGTFNAEGNLGIRDTRTGEVRLLTNKTTLGGAARYVKLSPDGTQVAHTWQVERDRVELRLIEVATGNSRLLLQDPSVERAEPAAWIDGNRLAVYADWTGGRSGLGVLSIDSGMVAPVTTSEAVQLVARVLYSPRTDELIFGARENPDVLSTDIFAVRLDGQQERQIVSSPAHDFIAGMSPSGDRLLYVSDLSGSPGIWTLPLGAAPPISPSLVVPGLDAVNPIAVSRDGTLYYKVPANVTVVYTAELDMAARRIVGGPTQVHRGVSPSWSPDGRRLALFSYENGVRPMLYVKDRDSANLREMRLSLRTLSRPQWRTNTLLTGYATRTGVDGFVDVDAATGEIQPLAGRTDLQTVQEGTWSSDGNTWYNRPGDHRRGIFRYDVRGRTREFFYVPPADSEMGLENFALSPDGRTLAFQLRTRPRMDSGTLMLLPTAGGEPRPLLTVDNPEAFLYRAFAWLPDSSALLAARSHQETNVSELWIVPVNGTPPQRVDFPAVPIRDLRLNPDGRTIAYHSGEPEHWELRVLENFLP